MSEVRFIRKKPNDSWLSKCSKATDITYISDSPSLRAEMANLGLKVVGTHNFTSLVFWSRLIDERDAALDCVDTQFLLRILNLSSSLDNSLKFHLRFAITELLYEMLLAEVVLTEYGYQQFSFDEGFITNRIMRERYGLDRDPISGIFYDQTSTSYKSNEQGLPDRVKKSIASLVSTALFETSLVWARFFCKRGILATSPGSGLRGAVEGVFSNEEPLPPIVYLHGSVGHGKSFSGLFARLQACFNRNASEVMAFPLSKSNPLQEPELYSKVASVAGYIATKSRLAEGGSDSKLCESRLSEWLVYILSDWAVKRKRDDYVVRRFVDIMKPSAVVAQHSLDLAANLGSVAKLRRIPSFLISHGSHVINSSVSANEEWRIHAKTIFDGPYDYTAIQTPASAKFYNDLSRLAAAYDTGPLIVNGKPRFMERHKREQLFGQHANKQIILHAGTPKPPYALRPLIYETTDEYLENIRSFVEAVSVKSDVYVAIRFRPSWGISKETIEQALPSTKNWGVYSQGSFDEYLEQCDALVSYSSTTIEQALYAGCPVILWSAGLGYEHLSAFSLGFESDEKLTGVWMSDKQSLQSDLEAIARWRLSDAEKDRETFQFVYDSFRSKQRNLMKLSELNRIGESV
ncbi:hypothetical protein DN730_10390 [Marinomonas piezotolerans]|uniref:Uncharacterized protein n=1 Tax=Marinomonas piezotolerans TaxID=2213058 RepID=A0A370U8A6_9GAMM|nr:hypothetical protein [Marinomonas piezotolerans]RDL44036.1 hypothetical protein DN730_10390 [Marinomonas piezotolerans]